MPTKPINTLKSFFEPGDRPTAQQFADLIDSFLHKDTGVVIIGKAFNATTGVLTLEFSDSTAINVTVPTGFSISQIDGLVAALDNKVTKETGKGLSANDYSAVEKGKVTTATQHINDATQHVSTAERTAWNGKVDKVTGKGLSTNDYDATAAGVVATVTPHIEDAEKHTTAGEKTLYANKIRSYIANETITAEAGETLRIFNKAVYKLIATRPFTTIDLLAEFNDATPKWVKTIDAVPSSLSAFTDDIGATEIEVIKVVDKAQIVNQVLDQTKKYSIRQSLTLIDGETINLDNSPLIEGLGADFTNITTTATNGVIFASQAAQNVNIKNISLSAVGTGSKVFDLKDVDANFATTAKGTHEFRIVGVNFTGCKDLGIIDGFRQFFATDLGFYGCTTGFELRGVWNGLYLQTSNLFGFAATGTLFRQGVNLSFADRCIIQMNVNVPAGAKIMDWQPSVFVDNEALQLVDWVAKIDGVKNDANGLLLFPNLSANNAKCLWSGNTGLPNTATEKIVIATGVTGTYVIDWLNDTYDLTLTGNTTFTEINLPASGRRTKTLNITISGNFTPTFPAGWNVNVIGIFKTGELNDINVKFISTGKYFVNINNSLTVYPAPILGSVIPVSLLPNSTSELRLKGSFYTPAGFVLLEGQVVNTIEFEPDTGDYVLSVTTAALEGEFDIIISNGTSVTFANKLIVILGVVHVPDIIDWSNIVEPIEILNNGEVKVKTLGQSGFATWQRDIPPTGINWEIRWKIRQSNLVATTIPTNANHASTEDFVLQRDSDNLKAFGFGIKYESTSLWKPYYETPTDGKLQTTNISPDAPNLIDTYTFALRFKDGILSYVENNVVKRTLTHVFTENMKIRVKVIYVDTHSIQYIELA